MPPRPSDILAIRVEQASPADLPALIALDQAVTGIAKPEVWQGYFASGANLAVLLARSGDAAVGYVVGGVRAWEFGSPNCGWVFAIGVLPGLRQTGVGTKLFQAMAARFTEAGVSLVRTMLHIDDHLLMSFFRAHGMTAGPFVELEMRLE
jgi:GNAT superfamily N-acetyltransferase